MQSPVPFSDCSKKRLLVLEVSMVFLAQEDPTERRPDEVLELQSEEDAPA